MISCSRCLIGMGISSPLTLPLALPFYAEADSSLISVTVPHILDQLGLVDIKQVGLTITAADDREKVLTTATVTSEFIAPEDDWQGSSYEFFLDQNIHLTKGELYYLELELQIGDSTLWLNGSPSLNLIADDGMSFVQPLAKISQSVQVDSPYTMKIQVVQTGTVSEVQVPYLVDLMGVKGKKDLTLDLVLPDKEGVSSRAVLTGDFAPGEDARGQAYTFTLDTPLQVEKGDSLSVSLTTSAPGVRLVPHAPDPVHESSWDDAVPYPVDGFSPYGPHSRDLPWRPQF